jgi:succinate dehydrogenase/fumarate reductase flavoprotein subunit
MGSRVPSEVIKTHVLILGGGIAGCFAAEVNTYII